MMQDLQDDPSDTNIQIIDLNHQVAVQVVEKQKKLTFSEALENATQPKYVIRPGDVVQVSVWEAPPVMLFGGGGAAPAAAGMAGGAQMTNFPDQMVNTAGTINIPFAGQVPIAGRTPQEIEADITTRLSGKAHQPQVMVTVTQNNTSTVTVIGDVGSSMRMPLTSKGERLLDALASSGGVKGGGGSAQVSQSVHRTAVQLTRGDQSYTMPLSSIIQDPKQNVVLQPGDVVTALFQSLSFTFLGAAGKNDEISFEAQGINLSQAIARANGLQDNRADASGLFIFRLEDPDTRKWNTPPATTPDGKVPVVYRVNLRDPATFFVAQNFPIQNKDVIYATNAPGAELQKFLNLVMTAIYPALSLMNAAMRF